jgi:rubrerythrin
MQPETWITLFLLGLLTAITGVAVLHEYRHRRIQAKAGDRVFRCAECSAVYTDDPGVERSRCPQCGVTNEPFKF